MKLPFNHRLETVCEEKNNSLCIGLDIDPDKFPIGRDRTISGMEKFAKEVIDGTIEFCPVYKPNFAFFERFGSKGYALLERLVAYIDGGAIVIADAKRGDIGNTSAQYAHSILEEMGCDAITISPYMGRDSIQPFIGNPEKGVFVLAVTSNLGASEIQQYQSNNGMLFETVIQMANDLNTNNNIGLVVGATKTDQMETVRHLSPGLPWLIPGIGAQGGDLKSALEISHQNGLGIVNVSRGILYAGDGSIEDVILAAKNHTKQIREIKWNPVNC